MLRRSTQLTARRFNSHGSFGTSKLINQNAFAGKGNPTAGKKWVETIENKAHHSEGITKLWKKLTYMIAIPAILLTAVPVGKVEKEHAEHRKHMAHVPDEEWPTQYEYQNIRTHKFFWGDGDKTLFWNTDINRHIED
ncbi:cytochrome c oxidase subunit 13, mitochondrial [Diutina catenulata]